VKKYHYYNEYDPKAAAWLRELIKQGLIPDGEVDERSIELVEPSDLAPFVSCGFFAGIGGWSLALRLAGWPDDRPVWHGSCPCQPFSAAGKGKGHADERHLWPAFFRLIRECRPHVVFGEQVASAIGHGWLDGVQTDLEGEDYAVGHCILGAHSVGAPHIRQRLYWLAHRVNGGPQDGWACNDGRDILSHRGGTADPAIGAATSQLCATDGLANSIGKRRCGGTSGVKNAINARESIKTGGSQRQGFWSDFDITYCRDGKHRRIPAQPQPGVLGLVDGFSDVLDALRAKGCSEAAIREVLSGFPLANCPGRVMLLKGYGNAITPQVAAEFIQIFMEYQQ
jgi:DNA (cytosine-5)-methyltransferase 1